MVDAAGLPLADDGHQSTNWKEENRAKGKNPHGGFPPGSAILPTMESLRPGTTGMRVKFRGQLPWDCVHQGRLGDNGVGVRRQREPLATGLSAIARRATAGDGAFGVEHPSQSGVALSLPAASLKKTMSITDFLCFCLRPNDRPERDGEEPAIPFRAGTCLGN